MVKTFWAEQLFVIGEIILFVALIYFGFIMKKLLKVMHKPKFLWILLIIAAVFIFISLIFHIIGFIGKGSVEDPVELMRNLGMIGMIEVVFLLLATFLSTLTGGMYFFWTHR